MCKTMKPPRQLSDAELRLLAVVFCGLSSTPYADFIDGEVTVSHDAEEIELRLVPYTTKVTLLLAAADYGRPH